MNKSTIITMFYDIRKKENHNNNFKNTNYYYELASNFILLLPYPIIFFIDPNNIELENLILNTRKDKLNITYIYKFKLEETYYYNFLDQINENMKFYNIENLNIQKDSSLYLILTNNKFFFIEKAIELNIFNSSHFAFIDFGINHIARDLDEIHNWFNIIPDKIKQLCINPYIEDDEPKDYFNFIYHNNAAGLFTGSKENLLKYSELFKNKWLEIINNKWYQLDEAIMSIIIRENYEMFDLYYGDYESIISNYLFPNLSYNLDIIISSLKKSYDYYNYQYFYNILKYLIPDIQIDENLFNEPFEEIINYMDNYSK